MSFDVTECIEALLTRGELLPERKLKNVCSLFKNIMVKEDNMVHVNSPATIVGDIHGQFYDLIELFSEKLGGGLPGSSTITYVFLGDYVDRGYNSVEVWQLLMLLKLKHPDHVVLLRGNHECRGVTRTYGFFDECFRKYGTHSAYKFQVEVFDYLPLAAVVDNRVFCVHGGLSPNVRILEDVRKNTIILEIFYASQQPTLVSG
jgi:hypothetical protein